MKSPFELVTDKKPAGGQPDAIAKLVKGYGKHERQTLLGITGSGKSLDYNELIFVKTPRGRILRTEIGFFVEHRLTSPSAKGDTHYQDLTGYKILSFDPNTGETREGDITQISRHREDELFEITLDDNSTITVTANHSCFRFKNGAFDL